MTHEDTNTQPERRRKHRRSGRPNPARDDLALVAAVFASALRGR
jgi:hypothetical protein